MWSLPASLHLSGAALLHLRKLPASCPDRDAVIAGGGASILGVGHFTVPPDVIVQASASLESHNDVAASWSTIRTIVVPHGIAAVPRRSPIKARKRTPWHPVPEAHGMVERGGSREWFADRLLVESTQTHLQAAWITAAMVHAAIVILVLLLLAAPSARPDLTPRPRMDAFLRMPAILLRPAAVAPPPLRTSVENPSPAPQPPRHAAPAELASEIQAAAPLEVPPSIEAEHATFQDAVSDGAAGGAEAGVVAGGSGRGSSVGTAKAASRDNGPFRVGDGIARPMKIYDVKPVYPQPAMAKQVGGSVVIEATIGADGKVHDARVLRSVAALDQAALDAVLQWEYEPSRLNGVAVAVIMVIVVTFSLL
jgi:periplasmic protein TonB